jgi:protein O-GlcNAc transferase
MLKPLALALLVASAPPPLTPQDSLRLGESYAEKGDHKRAVKELDKVLQAPGLNDEERARAHRAYGLALLQAQKHGDAAAQLEQSVAIKPTEKSFLLLGMAYDGAGKPTDAIAAYQRGVGKLPKSPSLHHELGMALLQAGSAHDAVPVLKKAADLAPQDAEVKTDLAYALVVDGKFKEAKEQASLALSMSRENADAYFNLGNAEAGLGDTAAAKQAFERAVDVDELHVPALLHLGLLQQKLGDDKAAIARFHRVMQVEPGHPRAQAALGASLARVGTDDAKAQALLERSIQIDPKYVSGHVLLGDIAMRRGDLDLAVKRYEAAKKLAPDDQPIAAKLDAAKKAKKAGKSAAAK